MATILANRPGETIAIVGDADIPLSIDIDGFGGFLTTTSILTGISLGLNGNYQVRPTLANISYIYVFGDKVGQMRLTGIALASRCNGDGRSGIEAMLDYYDANKVANRETPIQIQIGFSPSGFFRGALTDFQVDVQAASRFGNFTLMLVIFPRSNPRFYVDGSTQPIAGGGVGGGRSGGGGGGGGGNDPPPIKKTPEQS